MDEVLDHFCRTWYDRLAADRAGDRTVYHYTGPDGLLGILGDRRFRATNVAFLNDSTEYYLSLERIGQAVTRLARGAESSDRPFLDGVRDRLKQSEETIPAVYVVSFSGAADLLSQWRGYGELESGYALGFDIKGLTTGLKWPQALMAPCLYDGDVQDRFADDLVGMVADLWRNSARAASTDEELLDEAFGRLAWFAAFFKHPGFAEEREWRLVRLIGPDEVGELHFLPRATCIASYLPVSYDPATLREVWIGPSRHQHLSVPAVSALLRQQGFSEQVRLSRSTVPFRLV